MFKRIALVCVMATLMVAPLAWAEEDEGFGDDDETEMSSDDETPEEAAAEPAEDEASPAEDAEADEPAAAEDASETPEAPAAETPPTDAAEPASGSFNLNDGDQSGDGPPGVFIDEKKSPPA